MWVRIREISFDKHSSPQRRPDHADCQREEQRRGANMHEAREEREPEVAKSDEDSRRRSNRLPSWGFAVIVTVVAT
jgi:hypothetical protein